MTPIRRLLRRFLRDESATIMAEAVLVLPFMLWSYLGLFVYWDSFRVMNKVQKASYTISDMISREMVTLLPPRALARLLAVAAEGVKVAAPRPGLALPA